MISPSHDDTDENTDTFRCQVQKQQAGILEVPRGGCKDYFSTNSCRKHLSHSGNKVIVNKFRSVSEVPQSPTSRSECPAQSIPKTQLCPSVPMSPISCLQGLTLRTCERHIRALGTVAAWGRHNSRVTGWGSPPHRLQPTLSQGSHTSPPQHPDLQAA